MFVYTNFDLKLSENFQTLNYCYLKENLNSIFPSFDLSCTGRIGYLVFGLQKRQKHGSTQIWVNKQSAVHQKLFVTYFCFSFRKYWSRLRANFEVESQTELLYLQSIGRMTDKFLRQRSRGVTIGCEGRGSVMLHGGDDTKPGLQQDWSKHERLRFGDAQRFSALIDFYPTSFTLSTHKLLKIWALWRNRCPMNRVHNAQQAGSGNIHFLLIIMLSVAL